MFVISLWEWMILMELLDTIYCGLCWTLSFNFGVIYLLHRMLSKWHIFCGRISYLEVYILLTRLILLSLILRTFDENQILMDTWLQNCCNMRYAVWVQDHIMLPRKLAVIIDKSLPWCSPSIPMQLQHLSSLRLGDTSE